MIQTTYSVTLQVAGKLTYHGPFHCRKAALTCAKRLARKLTTIGSSVAAWETDSQQVFWEYTKEH